MLSGLLSRKLKTRTPRRREALESQREGREEERDEMIFDFDVQEFIENRIDRMPDSLRFRLIRFRWWRRLECFAGSCCR